LPQGERFFAPGRKIFRPNRILLRAVHREIAPPPSAPSPRREAAWGGGSERMGVWAAQPPAHTSFPISPGGKGMRGAVPYGRKIFSPYNDGEIMVTTHPASLRGGVLCRLRGTKQSNLHTANLGIASQPATLRSRLRLLRNFHLSLRGVVCRSNPHAALGIASSQNPFLAMTMTARVSVL
jgi:hypothetical protein